MTPYKICTYCIMDTSDPDIVFDDHGRCNHCRKAEKQLNSPPFSLPQSEKDVILAQIVNAIRADGKNKDYDCVIGVSGGVDSTYLAYSVKKLGLRPLAVHLDNGWNSELAVHNIEKFLKKLDIDLYTHVINWKEFKDLQLAFLKASTPDSEIPTDHAIHALLYSVAAKHNIKYVVIGLNQTTESILPKSWSHGHFDLKYIHAVHKLFGKTPLKTFPQLGLMHFGYYRFIKRIQYVYFFDYIRYDRTEILQTLIKELDWKPYGDKHHESFYTKFFQSYILPAKFGYDKRRAHLSNLIVAGQMSREEALQQIAVTPYKPDELKHDKEYVAKKFGISETEFDTIMNLPKKEFRDYPSHENSWYYKLVFRLYLKLKSFGLAT